MHACRSTLEDPTFARPPARAGFEDLAVYTIALDARAEEALGRVSVEPPVTICIGGERKGLPREILEAASQTARIPLREDGPDSLNAAVSAAIALYRMAADA